MTCVHKVRWSVKRPEECRFRLSVSHYKDRIVAPDEYSGATVVTPSDQTQILPTKDKTVRANITVNPAPTETLSTTSNGTFTPSDGKVGFSQVNVDVNPDLRPLSVSENGSYQPDGFDGFSRVSVDTGIKCVTGKFEVKRELSWGEALEVSIPHNLGTVPYMIVIWTHTYDETNLGFSTPASVWIDKDEFALPWGELSLNPYVIRFAVPSTGATNLNIGGPTHNITGLKYKPTATEFHLIESSAYKSYFPGIYYYMLVAGGWESYANNHMSDNDIYVVN